MSSCKVYLCCSIRGGRSDAVPYDKLVSFIQKHADVVNPFVTNEPAATSTIETEMTDSEIHERDMKLLNECSVLVAEVTQPSFGVGYEVGRAVERKKPVLCIYKENTPNKVSAMIGWAEGEPHSSSVQLKRYSNDASLSAVLESYFTSPDSPAKSTQ